MEKLAVKKKKCSGFEKEKSFSFIFVPIFVCLRVGAATEGNAVKKKTQPDSLHTSFFFFVCVAFFENPLLRVKREVGKTTAAWYRDSGVIQS